VLHAGDMEAGSWWRVKDRDVTVTRLGGIDRACCSARARGLALHTTEAATQPYLGRTLELSPETHQGYPYVSSRFHFSHDTSFVLGGPALSGLASPCRPIQDVSRC
jgi:hypothetical protein